MTQIDKMVNILAEEIEENQRFYKQLILVQDRARRKSEQFQLELSGMFASGDLSWMNIARDHACTYASDQFINVPQNCDASISEVIDLYFSGSTNVKQELCRMAKQSLSGLLVDTSVGEREDSFVFIYPENRVVMRVDVKVWKCTFSDQDTSAGGIRNVFAYTMAKSVIDHTSVRFDELLYTAVEMAGGQDLNAAGFSVFFDELKRCWMAMQKDNA